jgi:hypothetical protein
LNDVHAKVIFGVDDPKMVEGFVKGLPGSENIEIRTTKKIHAPFHVIDGRNVVMVVDNPLFRDGRVASVYAVDGKLARELHEGYRSLWDSSVPP